jgi:hypothetical protein
MAEPPRLIEGERAGSAGRLRGRLLDRLLRIGRDLDRRLL